MEKLGPYLKHGMSMTSHCIAGQNLTSLLVCSPPMAVDQTVEMQKLGTYLKPFSLNVLMQFGLWSNQPVPPGPTNVTHLFEFKEQERVRLMVLRRFHSHENSSINPEAIHRFPKLNICSAAALL